MRTIILISILYSLAQATNAQTGQASGTIKPFGQGYILAGTITGMDTGRLELGYYKNGAYFRDTARVVKGKFEFRGAVEDVVNADLKDLKTGMFLYEMYLMNTRMQLTGNMNDWRLFRLSGSPAHDDFRAIKTVIDTIGAETMRVWNKVQTLKKTDSILAAQVKASELDPRVNLVLDTTKHFIRTHPSSWMSLVLVSNLQNNLNSAEVRTLFISLAPALQQSSLGTKLVNNLLAKEKTMVGIAATNFMQNDVNGKPVTLDAYKGKYVLVDFWASWCGPCRAETPLLIKAAQKYKDLNILSVSLDSDKKAWLEAIKKDQMDWTNVCDFKGLNNDAAVKYGITTLPSNFLINPDGIIIARNLRGPEIDHQLAGIFKQAQ